MPTMAAQTRNHTMTCLVILLIQLGFNDTAINGIMTNDTAINGINDPIDAIYRSVIDKHHDTPALNFDTIHMNAELAILIHTVIPPKKPASKIFIQEFFSSNFWREDLS